MRGNGSDGWEEGWDEQEEDFFEAPAPAARVHAHSQQDQTRSAQSMNSARAPSPVESVASKIIKPHGGSGIRSSFAHFRITLLNGLGAKCNPKYIIFIIICVMAVVFYGLAMGDTGKPTVSSPTVTAELPPVKQVDGTLSQVKELKSDIRELADASSDFEDRLKALESALGDTKSIETPLLERLEAVEESVQAASEGTSGAKAGAGGGVDTATLGKIKALENLVNKLADRVKELENAPPPKAASSSGSGQHDETASSLTAFIEQLRNMEDKLADVEKKVDSIPSSPPAAGGSAGTSPEVSKDDVVTLQNTLSSLSNTMKEESKARKKMEDDLGKFNTRLSSVEHARERMRAEAQELAKAELELEAKKAAQAQAQAQAQTAPSPTAPTTDGAKADAPADTSKGGQSADKLQAESPSASIEASASVNDNDKPQGQLESPSPPSSKKTQGATQGKKAATPAAPVEEDPEPKVTDEQVEDTGSSLFGKKADSKSKGAKLGQDGAGQRKPAPADKSSSESDTAAVADAPTKGKSKKDGKGPRGTAAETDGDKKQHSTIAVGEPHPGSKDSASSTADVGSSAGTIPVTSGSTHEGEVGEDGGSIGESRLKEAMKVAQAGLADGLEETLGKVDNEPNDPHAANQQGSQLADQASKHEEVDTQPEAASERGREDHGTTEQNKHPLSPPSKKAAKKKASKDVA